MQYGKRGSDLSKSRIELLQLGQFEKHVLPSESVESLDSFLPQFHCSNREQLEIEHKIVIYLREKQIQFKTDPRQKELEYYEKTKKNNIIFQKSIEDSPQLGPSKSLKETLQKSTESGEFNLWLNPLIARKKQSQEQ